MSNQKPARQRVRSFLGNKWAICNMNMPLQYNSFQLIHIKETRQYRESVRWHILCVKCSYENTQVPRSDVIT